MAIPKKNQNARGAQPLQPIGIGQRAFSIDEFCRRYGLGRTKAYEEVASGRLCARKIGRRTIITEDDAESWLRHLPPVKTTNGKRIFSDV